MSELIRRISKDIQTPADRPGDTLRSAMRYLAGGVCVVTAGIAERRTGATVTSAHSFSIEPETMIVSINLESSTWPAIRDFGHFCVNILAADQAAIADRFAGRGGFRGPERYLGSAWSELATGAGVLDAALASIDCEVEHVMERHSHALVLGAVRGVVVRGGEPLIYVLGRYGAYQPT